MCGLMAHFHVHYFFNIPSCDRCVLEQNVPNEFSLFCARKINKIKQKRSDIYIFMISLKYMGKD